MAPLTHFLAAATLAGLGAAMPTKAGNTKVGTASLNQVRKPNYHFNGAVSMYKTYLKFGAAIPESLQAAVDKTGLISKRDTGSVAASPIDTSDDAYTIPVSIGTPAQVLNLDLDTGSSDLWVFSSFTPKSEVNGQTVYTPSKSSTSKVMTGETWKIKYGDQSTSSGTVYTDKVSVGGVVASSQAVEVAKAVSSSFTSDSSSDGLIGMGFDSLNSATPNAVPTFFDNIIDNLDSPLFTCDLKHNAPGTYDFGYIDDAKYTGDITYTDVNTDPGYWTFTSTGYGIGSGAFKTTSVTGIADTGTTLLLLDTAIVNAYYAKISGAENDSSEGGYVFPCDATVPSFTFGVESSTITIPSDYMNFGPVSDGSSTCFGGLQDNSDVGINIFGDVALKAAFVVFEGGDSPRLGWAAKDL